MVFLLSEGGNRNVYVQIQNPPVEGRRMEISITDLSCGSPLEMERLRGLAEKALRVEQAAEDTELSLALVSPERMAELNQVYLGREGPTDVMAFPMDEGRDEGGLLLGDVVVCPREVQERREIYGVPDGEEVGYALVHGILHLLGYRHDTEVGNGEMDDRVRDILAEDAKRKE